MTEVLAPETNTAAVTSSRATLVLRRFVRNKPAVAGLTILILMVAAAFALPPLLQYDYSQPDYTAIRQPPSSTHWFGTNSAGQDVLAQTLRGLQKSLLIGFCVALFTTLFAAVVGSVAGLVGGWTDRAIMWVVDLMLVVPSFIVIALFTPQTKGSGSIVALIVLLAAFSWMITARIVRGLAMSLREREFVQAARYMGAPLHRIIITHVLPNIASILIIDTTLNVGVAVLSETGLSYLGFGVQPPDVSLGSLIADGSRSALTYPWLFMFAGGLLVLTVLCTNLVGDGLRDALDPAAKNARARRAPKAARK